jgi:hypothetical protein
MEWELCLITFEMIVILLFRYLHGHNAIQTKSASLIIMNLAPISVPCEHSSYRLLEAKGYLVYNFGNNDAIHDYAAIKQVMP